MSNVVEGLYYTESHEWARVRDDGRVEVGITDHAQDQLGDIVYVELPEEGGEIEKGAAFGVVESVKTLSDVYAPVSGTIAEINSGLVDAPEKVNEAPYEDGWFVRIAPSNLDAELEELLDDEAYAAEV